DDLLPGLRARHWSLVGCDPVAARQSARARRSLARIWPVLYLLLCAGRGRAIRCRAPAGRLGHAVGSADRQRRLAGDDGAAGVVLRVAVEGQRYRSARSRTALRGVTRLTLSAPA